MNRVGWLSTNGDPVLDTLFIELDRWRLGARVVLTDIFDVGTLWVFLLFNNEQAIDRLLALTDAGQLDFQHVGELILL